MARVFSTLALFAVLLLLGNVLLALFLGDFGNTAAEYEAARRAAHSIESSGSATAEVAVARAAKEERLVALSHLRRRLQPHIQLGIAAALVNVLVNCISVTYFIGTSRWCREVVEAYGLDESLAIRSRRLKRRSFPFALLGVTATLCIIALGAASDPGSSLANPSSWVVPHALTAMAGTIVIAAAFYVQAVAVGENYAIIQEILAAAERIRNDRVPSEP